MPTPTITAAHFQLVDRVRDRVSVKLAAGELVTVRDSEGETHTAVVLGWTRSTVTLAVPGGEVTLDADNVKSVSRTPLD